MKSISILSRFSWLVAVVSVPFTVYIGTTSYFDSQRLVEDAQQSNRVLAEITAGQLARVMTDVQVLATELAKRPELSRPGTAECNRVLADFKQLHLGFLAASFNDEEGKIRCLSSSPTAVPDPVSIADLEWFGRLKARERVVVSAPYFGRIQKRWLVITAAPVFDVDGNFKGSVVIPLDLKHLARGLDSRPSPGNFVIVTDADGVVVTRYPDFEKWVGQNLKGTQVIDVAFRDRNGVGRGASALGVDSLIGFATIPSLGWHVIVGGDAEQILGPAKRRIWTSVGVGVGFAVAIMLIAFALATPLIRPIRELAAMARTLARGQFNVRFPEHGATEIAELARDFNEMAGSLNVAQTALRASERRFREMFENNSTVMMVVNPDTGGIVDANAAAAMFYGYSVDALKAMRMDQISTESSENLSAASNGAFLQAREHIFSHRLASGELRTVEVRTTPINVGGRVMLFSIVNDVTQRRLTEELLRTSEEHFRLALRNSPVIVSTQDRELRYTWIYNAHPGFTTSDVLGKTDHDVLPLAEANRLTKMKRQVMDSGLACREEIRTVAGGCHYVYELSVEPDRGFDDRIIGVKCAAIDITARKRAEDEIKNLAFFDALTGLPNRRLLFDRLRQAAAAGLRSGNHGALLYIDLDNFKTLNDTRGHDVGDLLLKEVGQRLASSLREGDTVARLGGDEFVVMLEGLRETGQEAAAQARAVGQKILSRLNEPYQLAGHEHHTTPSMGITLFGGSGEQSLDELLKQADLAMYQAKADGRNTFRFFDPEMQKLVSARANLESDLRRAVPEEQLVLHYQAQVDSGRRVLGAEVLVRWKHPTRGVISPAEFIPIAEENGLILPIGKWVLETACRQLVMWATQPGMSQLTLAVNVSPRQFSQPEFVEEVIEVVKTTGVDPHKLKLELTENILLKNAADTVQKMNALRTLGVGFSLDDFGTGYSSLAYLKRLPLAQLKIDQSFVRDILVDANDAAISQMIVTLAQSLGIAVIAEGVEREEQRLMLASQGCHTYQGYLFNRPVVVDDFRALVHSSGYEFGAAAERRVEPNQVM